MLAAHCVDGCEYNQVTDFAASVVEENMRLRAALEDVSAKARLGAGVVSDPHISQGFLIIAQCAEAAMSDKARVEE